MSAAVRVGDWIADRYEVFEIHRGGMGLVFIAHDHRGGPDHRTVALKALRHELRLDPNKEARFADECRLWIRLGRHPNIVQAFAVEMVDARPHVVLELVTGGDLRAWIGQPRLTLPQALRFAVQVCNGMEHALRAGVECHRDLKPANLLVTHDATLKISDFGLARVRAEILADIEQPIELDAVVAPQPILWTDPRDPPGPERANVPMLGIDRPREAPEPEPHSAHTAHSRPTRDGSRPDPRYEGTIDWAEAKHELLLLSPQHQTHSGLLLGTLPYMAPEQFADPHLADHRCDIYAFGAVLFEMLAGSRPFAGPTLARFHRQHCRYDPPSLVPVIPKRYREHATALEDIVRRCMRKVPDDRYSSFALLRHALLPLLRSVDPRFDPRR
jgi:serine/threonine protein kinase